MIAQAGATLYMRARLPLHNPATPSSSRTSLMSRNIPSGGAAATPASPAEESLPTIARVLTTSNGVVHAAAIIPAAAPFTSDCPAVSIGVVGSIPLDRQDAFDRSIPYQ
eukprot:CAMPEP_0194037390 /NCGR_PEP_ID=MMETSP0009_2-20130614/9737_1 /TAXON_ID=210454 /ORGANISM="Grammatophora oceanica, Strain CCMP 410" /LENGTH=108 /DNA_ID=CAMNT_0038679525 /DNA_START=101 /DNA_END=427 /DNA_ORIENTATION=-